MRTCVCVCVPACLFVCCLHLFCAAMIGMYSMSMRGASAGFLVTHESKKNESKRCTTFFYLLCVRTILCVDSVDRGRSVFLCIVSFFYSGRQPASQSMYTFRYVRGRRSWVQKFLFYFFFSLTGCSHNMILPSKWFESVSRCGDERVRVRAYVPHACVYVFPSVHPVRPCID